jgi:leader peptidase (prepilin peptidase)/N-methyltransferase
MITVFISILGLLIGSFLNVCIYRIPRGESIAFPPSHCTNCKNEIKWYDLIPVISYIFLKGKCRYCGEKISIRYPLIELITGALFFALYINFGLSFYFIKSVVLTCLLIVIGMIDYDTTDIYFSTTLTGIIMGCLFLLYNWYLGAGVLTYIYGALLGGGVIALIILLTHGMGWGDAELCLLCGLYLGLKLTAVMLFFAFVFGGIIGILLIITKKKSRKDYIPFGPYIALSSIFTMLLGEKILSLYLSLLN